MVGIEVDALIEVLRIISASIIIIKRISYCSRDEDVDDEKGIITKCLLECLKLIERCSSRQN